MPCKCKSCLNKDQFYHKEDIYEFISANIYDNNCCNLIKIAFSFFTKRFLCIADKTFKRLNELVFSDKISRRMFIIKYSLYSIAFEKINKDVARALRMILKISEDDYEICEDDYCLNTVAAIISEGLEYSTRLSNVQERLLLDRSLEECTINLIVNELHDVLKVVIFKCEGEEFCFRKEDILGYSNEQYKFPSRNNSDQYSSLFSKNKFDNSISKLQCELNNKLSKQRYYNKSLL